MELLDNEFHINPALLTFGQKNFTWQSEKQLGVGQSFSFRILVLKFAFPEKT